MLGHTSWPERVAQLLGGDQRLAQFLAGGIGLQAEAHVFG